MSAMAGVRLERLHDWAAPAGHIVRVVPLPQAARRQSLTAMYPDNDVARELFDRVGGVLVPSEEETLDAFSAATATFAAHLDYLATITNWLADHGVDNGAATTYTTHIFGQLGQSLLQRTDSLATLTAKHLTPGGINQQFMTGLRREGAPDVVRRAIDQILTRLREYSTPSPVSLAGGRSRGSHAPGGAVGSELGVAHARRPVTGRTELGELAFDIDADGTEEVDVLAVSRALYLRRGQRWFSQTVHCESEINSNPQGTAEP